MDFKVGDLVDCRDGETADHRIGMVISVYETPRFDYSGNCQQINININPEYPWFTDTDIINKIDCELLEILYGTTSLDR